MEDNITVKVSGTAVYRAIKQYLDNSPEFQNSIKETLAKLLDSTLKNRVESIVVRFERDIIFKTRQELDSLIKKEVETKVASYISAGVSKMFEGK